MSGDVTPNVGDHVFLDWPNDVGLPRPGTVVASSPGAAGEAPRILVKPVGADASRMLTLRDGHWQTPLGTRVRVLRPWEVGRG